MRGPVTRSPPHTITLGWGFGDVQIRASSFLLFEPQGRKGAFTPPVTVCPAEPPLRNLTFSPAEGPRDEAQVPRRGRWGGSWHRGLLLPGACAAHKGQEWARAGVGRGRCGQRRVLLQAPWLSTRPRAGAAAGKMRVLGLHLWGPRWELRVPVDWDPAQVFQVTGRLARRLPDGGLAHQTEQLGSWGHRASPPALQAGTRPSEPRLSP